MKALALALFIALLAAGVFIFMEHQAQQKLRANNADLAAQNDKLKADNTALSDQVTQANNQLAANKSKNDELLKLRGEVSGLRQQAGQVARLQSQVDQLKKNPPAAAQPQAADPADADRQANIVVINKSKQGVLGLVMFADDNQNMFPTNFSQAAAYYKNSGFLDDLSTNFDIMFQGPLSGTTNSPAELIVLREKQPRQMSDGRWARAYGFADGHSEIHNTTDGNPDDWEIQRTVQFPAQQ